MPPRVKRKEGWALITTDGASEFVLAGVFSKYAEAEAHIGSMHGAIVQVSYTSPADAFWLTHRDNGLKKIYRVYSGPNPPALVPGWAPPRCLQKLF